MQKNRENVAYGNRNRRMRREMWLLRQRLKKLRRRNRNVRGGSSIRSAFSGVNLNDHTRPSVTSGNDRRLIIRLPENLDFEANYEETVSHFNVIREAILAGSAKRIRTLDFSQLRRISPSAALVLASEVDQWNQRSGGRLKANIATWDEEIKRLLCQMGYFELLHLEKPLSETPRKNRTFLRFKRGELNKDNGAQLAKKLRQEIEEIVGLRIKKHFLFEGLSEAITNVGQHAYREVGDYRLKQWWLSASYDSDERRLCVMFYDHGDGIPKTLPKSELFESIKDLFNQWTDSQKIEAAMKIGRTSSGKVERGKGLQNFVEFAKAHRSGTLSIYSLYGALVQNFSNDGSGAMVSSKKHDFENSICGTLIEWSVIL